MKQPVTPETAYSRATALCAASEQCSHDILKKLTDWGINPDIAQELIERLQAEKYIDDSRYATAFARDKSRFQGWGREKIRHALRLKRIDSAAIADALEQSDNGEALASLRRAMQAKAKTLAGKEPQKARAALFRLGAARGFGSDEIFGIINELGHNVDDDEY